MKNDRRFQGAGGTSGGVVEFFIGFVMAVAGAYMLFSRIVVSSGFWSLYGYNASGLSFIPLIFGIGMIFFNGRSVLGWLLIAIGFIIIITGVFMNLHIYFQTTSLFSTIMMLALLAGGAGLLLRGVMPHREG